MVGEPVELFELAKGIALTLGIAATGSLLLNALSKLLKAAEKYLSF